MLGDPSRVKRQLVVEPAERHTCSATATPAPRDIARSAEPPIGTTHGRAGLAMLAVMGPSRNEILGAAALVGVLVLLMLVLVWWAIPPGGPPALQ